MNEDLQKNQPNNDEVDLGQLFNAIGKLFERLFRFIGSIFKALFSFVVFILKIVIINFKLIAAAMIVAFIIGFSLQKIKPNVYASQMLVKPYFDSKYQLVNNIDYFNTLVSVGDTEALSSIFEISKENAKELVSFDIKPGPESDNERVKAFGEFLESIDSASASTFTYKEFIANRDIYTGELFEITVESTKQDIFGSLESGLNSSFENPYSQRQREKRDTLLAIQKRNIMASLESIDSLKKVYVGVLKEDAKNSSAKISFGQGLSLEPENNSKTKEFQLLEREITLRNQLALLEETKAEEDSFYDVVSGFQSVGDKTQKFGRNYAILFPLLALLILTIIFMVTRTVNFVRNYDR